MVEKQLGEKLAELLISTPKLLIACGSSFLSGHVWLWLIYCYLRNNSRGVTHLKSVWAKTGLGMIWNALILFIIYIIKYGFDTNVEDKILPLIFFSLLLGWATQAVVVLLIIHFKNR